MKKNETFIQKALWSISGSEVWIIKDCPTAYKYYARQGLLFVMTFFFAAFCGAFAGNEFGGDIKIMLLFGLIWGFLVYSIDQMMVQTIDKVYVDTISAKNKFLKYFFPRMFLGCLLAMFMSSPLDHYLFKEQIEDQMKKNADKSWMSYQSELVKVMDIDGTKKRQKDYQINRDNLSKIMGESPTTIAYQEAKQNYEKENPKLLQLAKIRNNREGEMNKSLKKVPEAYDSITNRLVKNKNTSAYNEYLEKARLYNNAKNDYVYKSKEVSGYIKIMREEISKHEKQITEKINQQDEIIQKLSTKLEKDNENISVGANNRKLFVEKQNGFDTKFMTLLTHPNFGVQFLRWFVFLVFLLIEIIPTWMKLMGKPTEYDVKLDKIRKKRIRDFEVNIQQEEQIADIKKTTEIHIAIEKENQRKIVELDLYKNTLAEIQEKYEKIAKSILQDWENRVKLVE